jgi:hypothetical protein
MSHIFHHGTHQHFYGSAAPGSAAPAAPRAASVEAGPSPRLQAGEKYWYERVPLKKIPRSFAPSAEMIGYGGARAPLSGDDSIGPFVEAVLAGLATKAVGGSNTTSAAVGVLAYFLLK